MNRFIYKTKEEFHKYRNIVFVIFVFCMAAVMSFFATSDMHSSSAANLSNFDPGNIISDAVTGNYSSMTLAEIQNFLSSKNKCDNRDYNLYLQYTSTHPSITWHWEGEPYNGHFVCMAEEKFGDGEVIGSGMTAAEIIYDAAQKNKINPQVLLVLLQKESSLITDKVPNSHDYRQATGYGCPDTAACDSKYYGFKNQIYRAAELFRYTLDHGYVMYPEGSYVYVGYHPSSSCGGTTVRIANRATAALYRYTPYQPNSAALNAGYGTGDVCSAYGNRNFYLYFTDWFGSTQAAVDGELVTIPDGTYSLMSSVSSNRSLGLSGNNAVIASFDESDKTQRWQFRRDSNTGYYTITNVSTGRQLSVASTEVDLKTNVHNSNSANCSSQWKIYDTDNDKLVIESVCTGGMVLDVAGGNTIAGTNVEMYIFDGTSAQQWTLRAGQTISDGIYTLTSSMSDSKAIDIFDGSSRNGANIQIWNNNKTLAQKWQFTYNASTSDYAIINPVNQKSLDVFDARMKNGTNIQLFSSNQSCAQRWQIVEVATGEYTLLSACNSTMALDLSSANLANGSNIQLWRYDHRTAAQRWQLQAMPVLEDGEYTIKSAVSGAQLNKVLDLSDAGVENGTNIQIWNYNPETIAQEWTLTRNNQTGTYSITNPKSQKSLDIFDAKMANGTNIHLFSPNQSCAQRWQILENGDSKYTILNACHPSYALDVSNSGTANGTNVQIWTYDANTNAQKWSFIAR